MELSEEDFGGTLVTLVPGDSLESVPNSHRQLITRRIAKWWQDPVRALRGVAKRAVTPNMAQWFGRMADSGKWQLELHMDSYLPPLAGFRLSCDGIRGAEVGPPTIRLSAGRMPAALVNYYRLVGHIDWTGYCVSGGLEGPKEHWPLTAFDFAYHGADLDPADAFTFGSSPCGDMIIYSTDGRGGWLNKGSHEIRLLGSVLETIDWVYGELLADRCPDFFVDYG